MFSGVCAKLAATIAEIARYRAGGEIDAASNDHLRHGDSKQANDRNLKNNDEQALRIEEERVTLKDPASNFEERRDADQNEQDSQLGGQLAPSAFRLLSRSGTWRLPRLSFDLVAHYFSSVYSDCCIMPISARWCSQKISLKQGA